MTTRPRNKSLLSGLARDNTTEQNTALRVLACKRSLYPDKRDLRFDQESVDRVISHFETAYPDTTDAVLLAMIVPSQGDLTWSALVGGAALRSPLKYL